MAHRSNVHIVVFLGLSGVCICVATLAAIQNVVPGQIAMYPLGLAAFAVGAFAFVRRLEGYLFSDQWQRPLFVVLRERDQIEECDAFVRELLERMERAAAGPLPAESAVPSPRFVSAVRVGADEDTAAEARVENWKRALWAGVLAAGYPLAFYRVRELAEFSLPVFIVASTWALMTSGLSFVRKEPQKYWSLLGLALCLIPIVLD